MRRGYWFLHVLARVLHERFDHVLSLMLWTGGVREMAALLLGRLLTRPDQGVALREYLSWASQQLHHTNDSLAAPFLIPGTSLRALVSPCNVVNTRRLQGWDAPSLKTSACLICNNATVLET